MRLVVFGPGHPFRGGIASTTTQCVEALTGLGHEVIFATPRRQYPRWLYPGNGDQDPAACRRLDNSRAWLDPMNPLSWRRSLVQARAAEADAWIIPYWTWAWAGQWASLVLPTQRPPVVGIVHNPADHNGRWFHRIAARLVLSQCQALFTHAAALEDVLNETYPEIPTAHHGLAMPEISCRVSRDEARSLLRLPKSRRVALFVGFIRPYKGVEVLIEAVSQLPEDSDWYVLVAGEAWGDLGTRLQQQISEANIGSRIGLRLGWVPEEELPVLFGAADLVVLPYLSGSQSAVAPTALAHGVPVLSTAVGGLPEIIADGINGKLVQPGSVGALHAALEELDPETLRRLGANARTSIGHLNWSDYARSLIRLIQHVVEDRN